MLEKVRQRTGQGWAVRGKTGWGQGVMGQGDYGRGATMVHTRS